MSDQDEMLSSGVKYLNEMKLSLAVSYDDDTCPVCGNKMTLVKVMLNNSIENDVRFECEQCGFNAPIQRLRNGESVTIPLYDKSIDKFIKFFKENDGKRILRRSRKRTILRRK